MPQGTGAPAAGSAIGFAMAVERINRRAHFLALPRHDVDGIVQQGLADLRCGAGHEDLRPRFLAHEHGERSDVIKMCVRDENRIHRALAERR